MATVEEQLEASKKQVEEMKATHEAEKKALSGEAANYRKTASERKAALDAFGEFKPDQISEYLKLKESEDKKKTDGLKEAGKFEEIIEGLKRSHATELQSRDAALDDAIIGNAQLTAAANTVDPNQVVVLTRSAYKRVDGRVQVVDASGNQAYDDKGVPYTPETYTQFWLSTNPQHVKAGKGGAGSGGDGNGDGTGETGKTIAANDIGLHLEAVAKGEVTVAQP